MNRLRTLLRAVRAGLVVTALPASALALDLIEVTLPRQATPNLTAAIASAGLPRTVRAADGDSIRSLVLSKCGAVDPIYFSFVRQENAALPMALEALLPVGTAVVLPACAPQPAPELTEIRAGDNLSTFLPSNVLPTQVIDVAASAARRDRLLADAFTRPQEANRPLPSGVLASARVAAQALNEIVIATVPKPTPVPIRAGMVMAGISAVRNPNVLVAGTRVAIPAQRNVARTIALRPGVTVEAALGTIGQAAVADRITAGPAGLVRPTAEARLAIPQIGPGANCVGAGASGRWPLPLADIVERLADNDRLRPHGLRRERNLILVLDTGFDFTNVEPGYPAAAFPAVRSMMSKFSAYGTMVEPAFTQAGVNLATLSTGGASGAFAVSGREMRWHGAGVTSAALGSRIMDGRRNRLFAGEVAIASTIMDDGSHPPYSSPSALSEGIAYAAAIGAKVINYSFAIDTDPRIGDALSRNGRGLILVAAAGNSGQSVIDSWPARIGGRPGYADGIVITVGGHEPSGDLWPPTNRHAERVDLLAPACGVPAYSGELVAAGARPRPEVFAGTSLAAPLVSFVAGLLIAENLPPADVKTRIALSASVDGRTIRASYSGGLLNAPVALSVYSDALTYRAQDGAQRTVYGAIEDDAEPVSVCGRAMNLGKLHKLAFYDDGDVRRARYWWAEKPDALGRADTPDCPASEAALTLAFRTDDGARMRISADRLVDYTRRYFQVRN